VQPHRPQPSAYTMKRPHLTRPFIPTDLVQNTAEYLGRVAGFLSFRGVSTEWQRAVSDAVGFLNGRCWNQLEYHAHMLTTPPDSYKLWKRLRFDDRAAVAGCAVLCLRPRLETVICGTYHSVFPLRLLGGTNEALVTLSLNYYGGDLSCLRGCVALRELRLRSTGVTNESFAGLNVLLARLHKLDLTRCERLKTISNLAVATSLRELSLAYSSVEDLGGLEKLVALETLNVSNICTEDLSILRQCPQLVTLWAKGEINVLETIMHGAPPSLVKGHLHIDHPVTALDSRSLSCLRRSTSLTFSDLDTASLQGLEAIPSLKLLDLAHTSVDDVRSLASCPALRELSLANSLVTGVGIEGLERIATLETLNLVGCSHITSVAGLRHCTALRALFLDGTRVTDNGILGLERIATLTELRLANCNFITSVSSLRHSPSLRVLDICNTQVTATGTTGLDEIRTLECLYARGRTQLDAATLRRCRSLREVNLHGSDSVPDALLAALADVGTLEILSLSFCHGVRDVSVLARSVSLRELCLGYSAVCDTGLAGLERMRSLISLSLVSCASVTSVTNLFRSASLRKLILAESSVNDAGLIGLEFAPALEFVDLQDCRQVVHVAAVAWRAAERSVKVAR
jgi:Leucine-rich repeat (LRR) protein